MSIAQPVFVEGLLLVSGYWHGARAIRLGVPTLLAAAAVRRGASKKQRVAAAAGLLGFWSAVYAKYRQTGLEQTARDKMQTRRLDGPQAVLAAQQALLSNSLQLWKRRLATHAASIGRLATQTDSPGTLDAAQLEHLRRAMEIHGERARANTTT